MSAASPDAAWLRRAIALARPQIGLTGDNPAVGCVLVARGHVVGEGATAPGGRPHAEEIALEAAGSLASGAVAYVTLEPCGARSSGGPSCAERLVQAGIARVVWSCPDPSPYASGAGPRRLAEAGVTVEGGLLTDEAGELLR